MACPNVNIFFLRGLTRGRFQRAHGSKAHSRGCTSARAKQSANISTLIDKKGLASKPIHDRIGDDSSAWIVAAWSSRRARTSCSSSSQTAMMRRNRRSATARSLHLTLGRPMLKAAARRSLSVGKTTPAVAPWLPTLYPATTRLPLQVMDSGARPRSASSAVPARGCRYSS